MSTSPGFAARVKLIWQTFRVWRKHRPFWAGVFTLLSGLIIVAPPYASLQVGDMVVSISTIGGVSALLIGAIMIICGGSLWLRPQYRFVSGVVTMLLALVALVTVNLGSFLIGTVLGLIGGGLAIAWTDRAAPAAGGDAAAPSERLRPPADTPAPSPRPRRSPSAGEPHAGEPPARPEAPHTGRWQPPAPTPDDPESGLREAAPVPAHASDHRSWPDRARRPVEEASGRT